MPRRKLRLADKPRTAADSRKTVPTTVVSPFNHGIDRPERILDTVEIMFKRRQMDARQKEAADTYRRAFDTVGASVGGAMDFDKVRGATPGAPPGPPAMMAAELLRRARAMLGELDSLIVELIVGAGYAVDQATVLALGKTAPSERDCEYVGKRLRDALTRLADVWSPVSKGSKIRGEIADGARPVACAEGMLDRGRVAHAARDRSVRYSDRAGGQAPGAVNGAARAS